MPVNGSVGPQISYLFPFGFGPYPGSVAQRRPVHIVVDLLGERRDGRPFGHVIIGLFERRAERRRRRRLLFLSDGRREHHHGRRGRRLGYLRRPVVLVARLDVMFKDLQHPFVRLSLLLLLRSDRDGGRWRHHQRRQQRWL